MRAKTDDASALARHSDSKLNAAKVLQQVLAYPCERAFDRILEVFEECVCVTFSRRLELEDIRTWNSGEQTEQSRSKHKGSAAAMTALKFQAGALMFSHTWPYLCKAQPNVL